MSGWLLIALGVLLIYMGLTGKTRRFVRELDRIQGQG